MATDDYKHCCYHLNAPLARPTCNALLLSPRPIPLHSPSFFPILHGYSIFPCFLRNHPLKRTPTGGGISLGRNLTGARCALRLLQRETRSARTPAAQRGPTVSPRLPSLLLACSFLPSHFPNPNMDCPSNGESYSPHRQQTRQPGSTLSSPFLSQLHSSAVSTSSSPASCCPLSQLTNYATPNCTRQWKLLTEQCSAPRQHRIPSLSLSSDKDERLCLLLPLVNCTPPTPTPIPP